MAVDGKNLAEAVLPFLAVDHGDLTGSPSLLSAPGFVNSRAAVFPLDKWGESDI
jgi:hypothetical protein